MTWDRSELKLFRILVSQAALVGFANVIGRGSVIVAFMVLARGLVPAELSSVNFFLLTLLMVGSYATLGVGVASTRYFSLIRTEHSDVRGSIHALVVLTSIVGLVTILLVMILWKPVTGTGIDVLFIAALLFVLLDVIPASAVVGLQLYRSALSIAVVSGAMLIIGCSIASFYGSSRGAIFSIALSYALRSFGNWSVTLLALTRDFWRPFSGRFADIRETLQLVGPMAVTSILAATGPWAVGEMVRARSSDLAYSHYVIGLQWYSVGLFLPATFATVLLPAQVRAEHGVKTDSRNLLVQGIGTSAISALVVFVASVPASSIVIGLYGAAFNGEPWIVWGFVGAAAVAAPALVLGNQLVARGRQLQWTFICAIWLTCLVAFGSVIVPGEVHLLPAAFAAANLAMVTVAAIALFRRRPV